MNNTFFEKSSKVANDFIQNIVFLDDKAFKDSDKENTDHDLDALKISKVFAKESKICAVYRPESDEDINDFKLIAEKADVVILDWQIVFPQIVLPGEEEDDAPDEPRGIYTNEVIRHILFDDNYIKNSLKLIIVYTGDYTRLEGITEEIYKNVFNSSDSFTIDVGNCSISSSQIKVIVRAKSSEIANEANRKKYEPFMIQYEQLPSFILTEYTLMTSGLLANFALMALTTLRKNSSKFLGLFSREMDSAYLGHKSIVPKQEDSEDLLIELFGDSVKDLLYYAQINSNLRNEFVKAWIEERILEEEFVFSNHKFAKTHDILNQILESKEENIKTRFNSIFATVNNQLKNHLLENPTKIFTNNSEINDVINNDKNFSKLTHHKSIFIPKNTEPKLTLGTVVKSDKNDNYYICIQQKCDSVRIPNGTERKFLFIPLTISEEKFDIITPNGIKLKKDKSSFALRTIKFICLNDNGVILAEKNDTKYIFQQKYKTGADEQFEWILDLKDLHSQRIVIEYTALLSRVGLDESEWHRRLLSS